MKIWSHQEIAPVVHHGTLRNPLGLPSVPPQTSFGRLIRVVPANNSVLTETVALIHSGRYVLKLWVIS